MSDFPEEFLTSTNPAYVGEAAPASGVSGHSAMYAGSKRRRVMP